MSAKADTLFRPFKLKSLELENRIVMAPMTRNMAPEGIPGEPNAEYYRKRAAGGVGLILTEGTVIDRPASRNQGHIPFFHGEEAIKGWAGVADAVHEAGGKIGPQIWHTGAMKGDDWKPPADVESPSGLIGPDKPRGHAMSEEDIADTVSAFAKAAGDAERAGFDMLELHGAHGYLIDEFFWAGSNTRDDTYNGLTIKERSRFAADIVKAVRAEVSEDFPVCLRVSQWKQQDYSARLATTPDEMTDWLLPLVEAGVDILHCSQRRFWDAEFPEIDGEKGLNFAGWAKKLTGATTISVGSVGLSTDFFSAFRGEAAKGTSLDDLIERMEKDEFDLIAVGRALISDPDWVNKVRNGATDEFKGYSPSDLAELV